MQFYLFHGSKFIVGKIWLIQKNKKPIMRMALKYFAAFLKIHPEGGNVIKLSRHPNPDESH